ncbi:hypothetical protein ACLQ25_13705 [Micromonospora sp. DT44]|uniref:hypothetical protein n=1 Tax=Micromonospora sp. DT44 TaxID=3393439 RepID=UPI003CF17EDE
MKPNPGDILLLTKEASVQFTRPITFRVIGVVTDWITYDGWVWLDGYKLDKKGDAVEKRRIFVRLAGLRVLVAAVGDGRIKRPQRR